VLRQNCLNLEYTVIDVEPTDASRSLLDSYENKLIRKQCTREELTTVLNSTLQDANGEIMHWSSARAMFDPYALRVVAALFFQRPDVDWLHGRFYGVDDRGEEFWLAFGRSFCRRYFLKGNFYEPILQLESIFWRKRLWTKAGGKLDTTRKHACDLELWLRFSRTSRLHSTLYTLGGFHWPFEGVWTGDTLPYFHEAKRLVSHEEMRAGPTPLDNLEPPPLLLLS